MAIARNESLARIIMFFCFCSAIVFLGFHWRHNSRTSDVKPASVERTELWKKPEAKQQPKKVEQQNQKTPTPSPTQEQRKPKANAALAANPEMRVLIDLSDRRVYVYRKQVTIASYPTGIGKEGWETPTGSFKVQRMLVNPAWRHPITGQIFAPGADSPLGDRWIGFWDDGRNHIGFHGTPEDSLVGDAVSHGCLRMRTPDVRMLYKQVGIGTPVEVRE